MFTNMVVLKVKGNKVLLSYPDIHETRTFMENNNFFCAMLQEKASNKRTMLIVKYFSTPVYSHRFSHEHCIIWLLEKWASISNGSKIL